MPELSRFDGMVIYMLFRDNKIVIDVFSENKKTALQSGVIRKHKNKEP